MYKLVLDNIRAIAQINCGRAKSHLCPQHRILQRLAHKLRWMGVVINLYFVDSYANPTDPVSRASAHWSPSKVIVEAHTPERLYDEHSSHLHWGHVLTGIDHRIAYEGCALSVQVC